MHGVINFVNIATYIASYISMHASLNLCDNISVMS